MRTVTNTPDTLVLDATPWAFGLGVIAMTVLFAGVGWSVLASGQWIGGLMLSLGGIGMGLTVFWAFIRRTQLWLDRPAGRVALRSRRLTGFTERVFPLSDLTGAGLQKSPSANGRGGHRTVLRFGGQTNAVIPLVDHYVTGPGPSRTAAVVNAWLARNP
jgi:hypothetical protein